MTRLKKVSAYILCLMLSVLVLSGCSITEFLAGFFQDTPKQLAAPVLTLDETNETLKYMNFTTVYQTILALISDGIVSMNDFQKVKAVKSSTDFINDFKKE